MDSQLWAHAAGFEPEPHFDLGRQRSLCLPRRLALSPLHPLEIASCFAVAPLVETGFETDSETDFDFGLVVEIDLAVLALARTGLVVLD